VLGVAEAVTQGATLQSLGLEVDVTPTDPSTRTNIIRAVIEGKDKRYACDFAVEVNWQEREKEENENGHAAMETNGKGGVLSNFINLKEDSPYDNYTEWVDQHLLFSKGESTSVQVVPRLSTLSIADVQKVGDDEVVVEGDEGPQIDHILEKKAPAFDLRTMTFCSSNEVDKASPPTTLTAHTAHTARTAISASITMSSMNAINASKEIPLTYDQVTTHPLPTPFL
jgi:hypothetical protein